LCGTRRQGAEPAVLIRAKRLEWRPLSRGRDGVRRLANDRGFARNLAYTLAVAEIIRPHDDRTGQICRAREYARGDFMAWNRSAISGRNVGRRNARIHRKSAIPELNRSVHDDRVAEKDFTLSRWQDNFPDARRNDVTLTDENPKLRTFAIFGYHIVGRQGLPTDILPARLPAVTPLHPTGAPLRARNPHPAELIVESPTAVMIGHEAPLGLLFTRLPIPPVVL
jgi:hypothetical protein